MPYIKKEDRNKIAIYCHKDGGEDYYSIETNEINTAGDLQYAMAVLFREYIKRKGLCYQHCNDVMGALAGAQMEFYRKVVGPYEKQKEEQNGGIY